MPRNFRAPQNHHENVAPQNCYAPKFTLHVILENARGKGPNGVVMSKPPFFTWNCDQNVVWVISGFVHKLIRVWALTLHAWNVHCTEMTRHKNWIQCLNLFHLCNEDNFYAFLPFYKHVKLRNSDHKFVDVGKEHKKIGQDKTFITSFFTKVDKRSHCSEEASATPQSLRSKRCTGNDSLVSQMLIFLS